MSLVYIFNIPPMNPLHGRSHHTPPLVCAFEMVTGGMREEKGKEHVRGE